MKRLLLFLFALFLVLFGVVGTRTALRPPIQFPPVALAGVPAVNDEKAAALLARGVQFRTVAEREPGLIPAAEFRAFRAFLGLAFPRVHASLKLELVEGHTLLYTWSGRNLPLPPAILMGHYDVVPVSQDALQKWQAPPFAGIVRDGFIWGRGTLDDKLNVIGILHAAELLLESGFQPERTVYFLFGHDEEVQGRGARAVSKLLQERGVKPAFVLDEGGSILTGAVPGVQAPVALVGTAEKGYLTVRLHARGTGGHSSMPPPNTAVGIVAAAVAKLEANPLPKRIDGALLDFFRHTGPHMPPVLRVAVANLWLLGPVVVAQLSSTRAGAATVRTTTAATVFSGGVKENVLPEDASALVNFRLLPGDTPDGIRSKVKSIVDDNRVTLEEVESTPPSPVSPTDSEPFRRLGSTITAIFPGAVVSPYLVLGATDAKHFTKLTPNVYRFVPAQMESGDLDRIHGVNERIGVKNFGRVVRFYALLIRQQ